MKYYTKEWIKLINSVNYLEEIKKIDDKEYSKEEIDLLYDNELKRYLENSEAEYNELPQMMDLSGELTDEKFNPDDWCFANEETGEMIRPKNKEEVLKALELEEAKYLEEFNNRPPYDEEFFKEEFEEMFDNTISYYQNNPYFPEEIKANVDERLLGLNMLPEKYYKILEEYETKNGNELSKINNAARTDLESQKIDSKILDDFYFHDAFVKEFKKDKNDLVLRLDTATITFKKANVLLDEGITKDDVYLYDELYKTEYGYEIHMIFTSLEEKYLTIEAKDIKIKLK